MDLSEVFKAPSHPLTSAVGQIMMDPALNVFHEMMIKELGDGAFVIPGFKNPVSAVDLNGLLDHMADKFPGETAAALDICEKMNNLSYTGSDPIPPLRMTEIFAGNKQRTVKDDHDNGVFSYEVIQNDPKLVDPGKNFFHYYVDERGSASRMGVPIGDGRWRDPMHVPTDGFLHHQFPGKHSAIAHLTGKTQLALVGPEEFRGKVAGHTLIHAPQYTGWSDMTPKADGVYYRLVSNGRGATVLGRRGTGWKYTGSFPSVSIELEKMHDGRLLLLSVSRMPFPNYWGTRGLDYFLEHWDISIEFPTGVDKVEDRPRFGADWVPNARFDGIVLHSQDKQCAYKFQRTIDIDRATQATLEFQGSVFDRRCGQGIEEYALVSTVGEPRFSFLRRRPDKSRPNHVARISQMAYARGADEVLDSLEQVGLCNSERILTEYLAQQEDNVWEESAETSEEE
jgi:hypothetical protein